MKTLLIISIFFISTISTRAQLLFHNNTSTPVFVCYAKYNFTTLTTNTGNWYTIGWFKVDPNDRVTLDDHLGSSTTGYYYAYQYDANSPGGIKKEYTGNTGFLVDPKNSFSIKNANLQYVKDANPSYVWKSFRELKYGALQTRYIIEFSY